MQYNRLSMFKINQLQSIGFYNIVNIDYTYVHNNISCFFFCYQLLQSVLHTNHIVLNIIVRHT